MDEVLASGEDRMGKAVQNLHREFHTVRTGRANPALLDRVEVDYYGTPTPLKSLANVSTPDGRSLVIQPYDKAALKEIEQAIHKAQLGLTPNNDGSLVRINIPVLTEERRKELTKLVKKIGEEAKVAVRNVRRDCDQDLKKFKDQGVSEDELKRKGDDLQKLTDKYIKEIDKSISDKESEIMEI
ncbi:MAG: ribosome recycling factor [Candidatus Obscuribacterales bacterium]|nr:ribosome recycling factor [Candidatus Obscuribacterales bacterium]